MEQPNSLQEAEGLKAKWQPILEHPEISPIEDNYKKNVTAVLLENQEQALREASSWGGVNAPANSGVSVGTSNSTTGTVDAFDPVLISLVRRSMPNLMAYDVAGVQPMTGPTGLIFAMKSRYTTQSGTEALHNEADTTFSGHGGAHHSKTVEGRSGVDPFGISIGNSYETDGSPSGLQGDTDNLKDSGNDTESTEGGANDYDGIDTGRAMTTARAETLGASSGPAFQEMAFSIEKQSVTAKSRALKAEYTTELAQDLKAVHGLDAETELANILSTEILAEINREMIRTIYRVAKLGAQQGDLAGISKSTDFSPAGGIYDLNSDSDGRWSAERFRGLIYQIERECNVIARATRRGKGNFIICSSDVASALSMSGQLDFSPAFNGSLAVDDTGNTFVGVLNGRLKVYVDPYAERDYVCVGYRGSSAYDAGLFYCPYVPLQMVRAVGENTFQPKIGFKTRYGLVSNPFVETNGEALSVRTNQYYRIFRVDNLHGN
jgi:hypothetical protein